MFKVFNYYNFNININKINNNYKIYFHYKKILLKKFNSKLILIF